MTVEGLLDTKIMQIQPFTFAKETIDQLIKMNNDQAVAHAAARSAAGAAAEQKAQQAQQAQKAQQMPPQQQAQTAPPTAFAGYQQQPGIVPPPQYGQPGGAYMQPQGDGAQYQGYPPPPYAAGYGQPPGAYAQPMPPGYPPHPYVNVQPATFQPFDEDSFTFDRKNIGLVMDVQLEVSVELGRTRKLIKDILEFGQGSIIELDKLAGEPVDILVNSKAIAKGEVVVIDESFGVRVVDIIHPSKRIA
jgi:flagellar motor switch protein FliN/FliY